MPAKKRYVVVCTDKRGVFGGFLASENGTTVHLTEARMCVYWSTATKGVVGLAKGGPTEGCRITDAAPKIKLNGVTAIFDCTEDARKAWEAAPWS